MHLYEITDAIRAAMDAGLDTETGEISENFAEQLDALDVALEEKIENCAAMIKNLHAEYQAFSLESARMAGKARTAYVRENWLKRYVRGTMEALGRDKVKGKLLSVSLQAGRQSVDVIDAETIPGAYVEYVTSANVDKRAILAHFKATGEDVPGVTVRRGDKIVKIT